MNLNERAIRLKTLTGHLLSKYDLKHHSYSHISFNVKSQDVIQIVKDYQDVLSESNLFISKYNDIGSIRLNSDNFEVSTTEKSFYVNSKDKIHNNMNNFETYIKMNDVSEIEICISCNTILTFEFSHKDAEYREMFSFRRDIGR